MRKIGILSDIHGNLTALEAVIADAKAAGVEEYWFLGDLFLSGHGDKDLLSTLQALPLTIKIKGNWDDSLLQAKEVLDTGLPHSLSASDVYLSALPVCLGATG